MSKFEIAYGRNNVLACFDAKNVLEVFVEEGFNDNAIFSIAREQNIKVTLLNRRKLNELAPGNNQGVAAKVSPYQYAEFQHVLKTVGNITNPIFLLLDEITDPHNFGAIIRSAEAFGVTAIIIKKDRQVDVNATVMKVATGAQNNINIIQVPNINGAIAELKKAGFWVVGTSLSTNRTASDLKYDFPVALVVGNEGKGMSQLVTKNCDYLVKIPMQGKVNSLNVSVATGVMLAIIRKIQLYF